MKTSIHEFHYIEKYTMGLDLVPEGIRNIQSNKYNTDINNPKLFENVLLYVKFSLRCFFANNVFSKSHW